MMLALLVLTLIFPPTKKQHTPAGEEPAPVPFSFTTSTISFGQLGPGSGRVEGRGTATGRAIHGLEGPTNQETQNKYPA